MTPDVYFFHGLESGPWGTKSLALQDAGFDVVAPDFRGERLAARVAHATAVLEDAELHRTVIVGSSYGGAVAVVVARHFADLGRSPAGVVLCAPALRLPEPPIDREPSAPGARTRIVHGIDDDIVPIAWSRDWAAAHAEVDLVEVDDGHRLAGSIATIVDAVRVVWDAAQSQQDQS